MAAIETGQQAPDFELKDTTGQPVRLSDYLGKKALVLVFYPFAFSSTCSGELCSIRDDVERFHNDDVETLAVSTDPTFALRAWSAAEGFEFPLLSDFWPHGDVARRYGVFNDQVGAAERGTFVIDKDGQVVYAVHNDLGDARDNEAYLDALRGIGAI